MRKVVRVIHGTPVAFQLVNKRKKQTIYLEIPANFSWELKKGKVITVTRIPKREEELLKSQ